MYPDDNKDIPTYIVPPKTNENLTAGVALPFLQAAIGGILAGASVGALVAVFKLAVSPWAAGGLASCLFAFYSWLSYRGRWSWRLERLLQVDLDQDGFIGQPPQAEHVRVELIQDQGRNQQFIDLPSPDKLPQLAAGLLEGRTFSQSVWTGGGQLFTRGEFETLRAELLRRGLASWKNPDAPAQGIILTAAGRAIFKRLAAHPPTPCGR